jgi:transposase
MALRVRTLTEEEEREIQRLARSRMEPARRVERAQMIWSSHQGLKVPAIARQLSVGEARVRRWIERFNGGGLKGLEDQPRPGKPPTYSSEQVGELLVAALTKPDELGLPFSSWTLDRLEAYLNEQKGIGLKRSRIDEILLTEGLRWRGQESWFGERVDPDFVEKRGGSNGCIRTLPRARS